MTQQDVEQARAERVAANNRLMDEMEKSVETQGDWFVKLGTKRPITQSRQVTTGGVMGIGRKTIEQQETVGYDDDRALILKATRVIEGSYPSEQFIVVTPDGIMAVPFYHSDIDNPKSDKARGKLADYQVLKDLTSGKVKPTDLNKYVKKDKSRAWARPRIVIPVSVSILGEATIPRQIDLEEPNQFSSSPFTSEDFGNVVQESIKLTESPFKKNVEVAKQETQLATNAVASIRSLPPRE